MTLSTGQVVENRYRIVELLGQGGFGAVYRAWDIRLSRPCALKGNLDSSPEAERQFGTEAVILANLNHPNLPRVIDHFTVPGQGQYLVMDFVEGEDLQQMLDRRGLLPEAEVLPWIVQVCDALAYLHSQSQPVIHRDVKPANIKITPNGVPMLVDFGIAKVYDPALRTTLGARAVTPGYSPPEQYGQGRTDVRSDVYALGATLYALLTGSEPVDSVERIIGSSALVPPREANPCISEGVARAIMRALTTEPVRRFQTAGEFKIALAAGIGLSPSPAIAPIQVARDAPAAAVGVARPSVSPLPGLRQAPDTRRGKRVARILAVVSLVLGLLSWMLSCVLPVSMVALKVDAVIGSVPSGALALFGLCGGYLSVLVVLIMGILVLTKSARWPPGATASWL